MSDITIVEDIISKVKEEVGLLLTDFNQLDYEFDINKNADNRLQKRYGFIPLSAEFVEGRTLQHSTFNHIFQLLLTNDFQSKDDDTALSDSLNLLYKASFCVQQNIQCGHIVLTNPDYKVLIFRAVSFEDPEYLLDNGTVALRVNFTVQYRFRKI